jgi:hypothetical protein
VLTSDQLIDVAFSLLMLYFGLTSMWSREFGLTLGNSQIILIKFKDGFALVWGGFLTWSGILLLLPVVAKHFSPGISEILSSVSTVNLYLLGFVFVMCILLQYAVYLGEWLRKYIDRETKTKR